MVRFWLIIWIHCMYCVSYTYLFTENITQTSEMESLSHMDSDGWVHGYICVQPVTFKWPVRYSNHWAISYVASDGGGKVTYTCTTCNFLITIELDIDSDGREVTYVYSL